MTDPLDQICTAILANCDEIVIADLKTSYSNLIDAKSWCYEDADYSKKVRKALKTVLRFYMSEEDYQEWKVELRDQETQ